MGRGTKILLIGTIILILVLTFFAYFVGIIPKAVTKVDEKDFDILGIEYVGGYNYSNNETYGSVKLSVQTKKDNLIISAFSKTNTANGGLGCSNEFGKAGFQTLESCRGDPSYTFVVSPINQEHNFIVCASVPWSIFYRIALTCKSIILPAYFS